MPWRCACSALLVVLVLGGETVAAPDPAALKARALFDRAEIHFSVGEFTQALELYKEAYKLKPLPGFLFNIGQCQRKLGRCDQALHSFYRYLEKLPDAPNREIVQELIRECEAAQRQAPARPPSATSPSTAGPPRPVERRGLHPAWFWSTASVGAALLIAGAVTGGLALSQSSEYKDGATSVERRRELKDSGERLGNISTYTLAAGGAVAAASVVLAIFTRWRPERAVSAGVLPGGGAILVGGGF